jgi:hypothetical protein
MDINKHKEERKKSLFNILHLKESTLDIGSHDRPIESESL